MSDMEERLTELEIRFSHQSMLIEELSDELVRCRQAISNLERENAVFREMFKGLGPEMTESPDE